ncbi:DUF4406 domain-containing protein [Geothrix campi]|uniref:DUF4406 domain-containing protein n=1 Tax=Geothrix campi TaxID=2966450 RepID=UPI002148BAC3|nr:DUF4406 domain-containing protein [Geothrix sp. SG10]
MTGTTKPRAEDANGMDVIYVAGPYSAATPQGVAQNVAAAVAFGQKVRALGALPVVPHLTILPTDDYEAAMRECFEMIRRSDAVILMPTWKQSPGAGRELDFARALGLTVFDHLVDLASVYDAQKTQGVGRALAS